MGIKKWSRTAASNDSISSSAGTINWKEGMPPSAVNDSARVTMADVRDWFEDAQWVNLGDADGTTSPRRASNEISLSGTHTLTYHVGRRLKAQDTTGTKYGTITATTYSGGTQITLLLDSGTLTGSVSQVFLSALTATNPSGHQSHIKGLLTTDSPTFAGIALGNETMSTYDEGSWTPAISLGGGSVTYTTQAGKYIRIGKLVVISGVIQINTISTPSGALNITGLPYTITNANGNYSTMAPQLQGWASSLARDVIGRFEANTTIIRLQKHNGTTGYASEIGGDLANSAVIYFGGSYLVS